MLSLTSWDSRAAVAQQIPEPILLWPADHPANAGEAPPPADGRGWVAGVPSQPALIPFLPAAAQATGGAVLICPGGGYSGLAIEKEGYEVARWLNSHGAAGFVLRYRCGGQEDVRQPAPWEDAVRAIRMIRSSADRWGVDPAKVGVLGFSAGGHLASSLAVRHAAADPQASDSLQQIASRPDFAVLVYPVISMSADVRHGGSRRNLLGSEPSEALARAWSSELQVDAQTPPTFLVHASDDQGVPPQNSLLFYDALQRAGVAAELHIYERGGHGFGMLRGNAPQDRWPELLAPWLARRGVLREEANGGPG